VTRALLGLGSNEGDRAGHLRAAVAGLAGRLGVRPVVSPVYRTAPVGGPEQDDFYNMVVRVDSGRAPRELLAVAQALEADAGRVRTVRWGPRPLDVDILWVDGVAVDEADLQVPHPRMFERRFVLAPLRDVAPDLVDEAALAAATGEVTALGDLDGLDRHSGDRPDGT
jgi:2-amino-4-hydroxy-6-hydroxymethyldihydropteridine diphosphokinase